MASGPHLDPEAGIFFGYSISEDFSLLQDAPDPAPGAPLLSDIEQSALNSWFDDMKSDDRSYDNLPGNAIHSENWIDVPQFVGSTTSFGQPQDLQHGSLSNHLFPEDIYGNMSLMFTPIPGHVPQPRPMLPSTSPAMVPASRSSSSPALSGQRGSDLSHGYHFSGLPGTGLGIDQPPSEDMVAAANTLLSNSHHESRHASFNYGPRMQPVQHNHHHQHHHSISGFDRPVGPMHTSPMIATSPSALLPPTSHHRGPQLRTARTLSSSASPYHAMTGMRTMQPPGPLFTNDGSGSQQMYQQIPLAPVGVPAHQQALQWGTDESFGHKQFIPRSEKETSEALINIHFKSMECLAPNHSTASTQPSSPSIDSAATPRNTMPQTSFPLEEDAQIKRDSAVPPPKRRKGKAIQGEDNEKLLDVEAAVVSNGTASDGDEYAAGHAKNKKPPRKRKAKAILNGKSPLQSPDSPPSTSHLAAGTSPEAGAGAEPAPTKRRRSAAVSKPPRENLSEEQKRENHIKSEQKRRTLIKTGFDDLCILVPGLQGGNLSKSLVLTTAVTWLTELLEGNKRLESQLSAMDGGAAASSV
ncbi:hypothetical protein SEPCBS119000_001756 [Sporothrix epigloea]|uniref:BHLH domain-containing protein n=1 Tax=Sporothrix epigloea TaxID=1892477 RepID=A0ABP0DF26_9PEZI